MLETDDIYQEFKLPINYCMSKRETAESMYDDLELLKNKFNKEYTDSDVEKNPNDISNNCLSDDETLEDVLEDTLSELFNKKKPTDVSGNDSSESDSTRRQELNRKVQELLLKKIKQAFTFSTTTAKTAATTKSGDISENPIHDNSFYNHVFSPKTTIAQECVKSWSTHYTTNVDFLKESQKLYNDVDEIKSDNDTLQKTWDMWRDLKNDESFYAKYNFVDISFLMWLNHYEKFLTISNIYNIASPALNLLSPLVLLIVPFIIMKLMKVQINVANYVRILKQEIQKKGIGRLFSNFGTASWTQRVYILLCLFMYGLNIYQNIQSCINFKKNMEKMRDNYALLRTYCTYTTGNMKLILQKTKDLKTYNIFNTKLRHYCERMEEFSEQIQFICLEALSMRSMISIGNTMKHLYKLYTCDDLKNMMLFSFGFNGYIETLTGLHENIKHGYLSKIKLMGKRKTRIKKIESKPTLTFKNMYHPATVFQDNDESIKANHDRIVKNDIKLRKNKIITGPNAAGKTTILKATTVNLLLSQQIGFGYYSGGKLVPFDYIHCYINIPDTGSRDSLFQAEARRCANILNIIKDTPEKTHFCIFDELFSGTNPYEAISGAKAYLMFISANPNVRFMLTTHFIKLCEMFEKHKKIGNFNLETQVENNAPKYTYKLIKGISKTKGGIFVLRDLDYPEEILRNAHEAIGEIA